MKPNSGFKIGDLVRILYVEGEELKRGDVGFIIDLGMSTAWVLTKDGKERQVFISCLLPVTERNENETR